MCAEIEEHVREAIAMRDEMAKWDTPLREWAKLQQMPVLKFKSELKPEPKRDDWSVYYQEALHEPKPWTTLSTNSVQLIVRAPVPPPTIFDGVPSSLALMPPEMKRVIRIGDILNRGNGRYQVVSLDAPWGRAMVVRLRD